MRAWQIGAAQGIESLECIERPTPRPAPGEVLVRVSAAALNHRDLLIVAGRYPGVRPPSRVPLGDGVGVVEALGAGVTQVAIGERVSCVHFLRWIDGRFRGTVFDEDLGSTRDGWLGSHVVLPAAALVRVPEGIEDPHAAALPAAGVTAWSVLHAFARVQPGEVVLTIGTGGVSLLAMQLAAMAGARTVLLSSSAEKLAAVRKAGIAVDLPIDTSRDPDWPSIVQRVLGGADVVVETVGAATLGRSIAASADNGRIGLVGALGGRVPPSLDGLIRRGVTVKGIASGNRAMLAELYAAYSLSGAKPLADLQFSFNQAPAAYAALSEAKHLGKIVIRMV